MKKLLTIILMAGMTAVFGGCNVKEAASIDAKIIETKEETRDTKETQMSETETESEEPEGILAVAVDAGYYPYGYQEDDQIVGLEVDIMRLVAESLNMEFTVTDMPYDALASAVNAGKSDVAVGHLTASEEMLETVDFTDTYLERKQVIVVPEESGIGDADDLNGIKLGALLKSAGESLADDISEESLLRYDKASRAVEGLVNGKVDALILDEEQANAFAAGAEGLKILEDAYETENYAAVMAKGSEELLARVNEALAQLKKEGKIQEIIDQYIPVE